MQEAANESELQKQYPLQINKLGQIKFDAIEYSIIDTLINLGISNESFINEVQSFWKQRFFSNEYVKKDWPVEGALKYVTDLYFSGATIVHLTGRDDSMREGTLKSLRGRGFPLNHEDGSTILITKEKFEIPDAEYKQAAFKQIERLGEVVAMFENEPKNINLMVDHFKNAIPVFLDIKHSPAPVKPYASIVKIKNFGVIQSHEVKEFTVNWQEQDAYEQEVQMCDDRFFSYLKLNLFPPYPEMKNLEKNFNNCGLNVDRIQTNENGVKEIIF